MSQQTQNDEGVTGNQFLYVIDFCPQVSVGDFSRTFLKKSLQVTIDFTDSDTHQ